jgi:hypothetical protein
MSEAEREFHVRYSMSRLAPLANQAGWGYWCETAAPKEFAIGCGNDTIIYSGHCLAGSGGVLPRHLLSSERQSFYSGR